MKNILKQIESYLREENVNCSYNEEHEAFIFSVSGDVTDYTITIYVPNEKAVIIWAKLPITIPNSAHKNILKVINKINGEAIFSFLHLHHEFSTVNSQTSFVFENREVSKYVLITHISSVVMLLDTNIELILSKAFGEQNFKEYIYKHNLGKSKESSLVQL
ncbi:MAG: hypothetical protein R3Y50_06685 [Rikenellaceae bacterium]